MSQPDVGAESRMYGMMQHLMTHMAQNIPVEITPERGIVTLQDALDATMQISAVIDEATQTGRISPDRGAHAAAMLMLIRDYIQPLPRSHHPEEDVPDLVTPDLNELAMAIRTVREASGLQG